VDGIFDISNASDGWFDVVALEAGWFDVDNIVDAEEPPPQQSTLLGLYRKVF
jgi:hypothetical protein